MKWDSFRTYYVYGDIKAYDSINETIDGKDDVCWWVLRAEIRNGL